MWGDNQYFQLTRSDHNKETTPRKVNFELSAHICSISCELANHVGVMLGTLNSPI